MTNQYVHDQHVRNKTLKAYYKVFVLFCYILSLNVLSGCSTRENAAPVANVSHSILVGERVKQPINQHKYKVQRGETLYTIAWRANSDVRTIANINNIRSPYKIFPGQVLYLTPKKIKTSNNKGYGQKSNNSSSQTSKDNKNSQNKNKVASTKKQAYGEKVVNKSTVKKASYSKTVFSQKISRWQWPTKGKVIATFSTAQQGNKGIDITNRRGTTITASAKGKVVYVGEALRGYGKLIIIKHNEDYLSAYAHNDKILVKEKQQVNVGDVIAKMGDTGAQKVMLHFEIRFRGKSVNPLKYLPKK